MHIKSIDTKLISKWINNNISIVYFIIFYSTKNIRMLSVSVCLSVCLSLYKVMESGASISLKIVSMFFIPVGSNREILDQSAE